MGYQLQMHDEVREWLTGLRETEPERAREVGQALLALIDAGDSLGPPLVLPLEAVTGLVEDPREALDLSYQRQLEMLTQVRRGVADVATSRKRLELQMNNLEAQLGKRSGQRAEALRAGRQDLAGEAQARVAALQEQLAGLSRQYTVLQGEEVKLTLASQRLQAKVESFRMHKETLKATYTAAETSRRIREVFAEAGLDLEDEAGDADPDLAASTESVAMGSAEAGEELLREGRVFVASASGDVEAAGNKGVPVPDGLFVLRPSAPDDVLAGLLYVVQPAGAAILLAHVAASDGERPDYEAAVQAAAARMPTPAIDGDAGPDGFRGYEAESFLDEFFPGEETEVEIAAAALVARNRAHTLAEARQRMRMTQDQVARRMSVRQERVSAIERAEPGATEVRTLAAYVRALGGSLEIVAHIGDERIVLG